MKYRRIYITGASSGIGCALAREMAGEGITLGLVARRKDRLQSLKTELESLGSTVFIYQVDVSDMEKMGSTARKFIKDAGGADLIIANAGIGGSDRLASGDPENMIRLISVNISGVVNTLVPFIPHLVESGGGHLVAVSSVAGFRSLPGRASYGASKAAVKFLMDGFRLELRAQKIRVTTICPGFVESELTDNNRFPMPFFMKTAPAAKRIRRAIERGLKTCIFPWQWRILIPIITLVPDWMIPKKNY